MATAAEQLAKGIRKMSEGPGAQLTLTDVPPEETAPAPEETPVEPDETDEPVAEAEPEPETPAAETPAPTDEPPAESTIEASVLARAQSMGFTEDELSVYTNTEQLESSLDLLDSRIARMAEKALPSAEQPTRDEKPVKPAPTVSEEQSSWPLAIDLPEDEIDERVTAAIRKLEAAYNSLHAKHETLEKERDALTAQTQQQQAASDEQAFDSWVAGKSKDKTWSELLGKGAYRALRDPKFVEAREKLFKQAVALFRGYQNDPSIQIPSREELFDRAARIAFPEAVRRQQRARVEERVLKGASNTVLNGGGRRNGEQTKAKLTPQEQLAAGIKKMLKQRT